MVMFINVQKIQMLLNKNFLEKDPPACKMRAPRLDRSIKHGLLELVFNLQSTNEQPNMRQQDSA